MLNDDQLESFQRNGYQVVEHVLDDSDLQPLEREYAALLDELANRLYQLGEIDSAYAEFDFAERFARVVAQYPECIDRIACAGVWTCVITRSARPAGVRRFRVSSHAAGQTPGPN